MTTMLGFLTVLFCATVVWANVTPIPTFKLDVMKGKWYNAGAATNAKWFTSEKDKMKMEKIEILPTVNGNMNMTISYLNDNGTCWKTNHLAKKAKTSGQFSYHSDRWGDIVVSTENVMRVIDANFDYAILHITQTKKGESSVLIKLYSRAILPCTCVVDKYLKLARDSGIDYENIMVLPYIGEC